MSVPLHFVPQNRFHMPYILFGLFMNLDKLVVGQFAEGVGGSERRGGGRRLINRCHWQV